MVNTASNIPFKKQLIKKTYEVSNDFAKSILIFISGLEAQEKINQEQASQKQETQQQK